LANVGAIVLFGWVAISVLLAMTSDKPADYQGAASMAGLAIAAYFSGVVAKMMAGIASARQHQFGNNAVTIASAPFTDLCFALALAISGAVAAPTLFSFFGGAGAGVACSMLLGAIGLCIVVIMPTAYRLSAPLPQQ
jgi:hypothetical protein